MAFLIKKQKQLIHAFLISIMIFFVSLQAHADIKLSFGLYTSDKATTLVKKFRPILKSLEKKLSNDLKTNVSIKFHISKSYDEGILALQDGKVDFARFGPASYIQAIKNNPGISLLVMETKKGKKVFKGIICVHEKSDIQNVSELKGKSFAFGSKRSTIGRYLSQEYLLQNGIKARDLAHYDYLGRHDTVGYAVAQKKYTAGALKESTFKKLVKKGQPLRKIATFNNVTKPWVARSGLDKNVHNALRNALLSLKDKKILSVIKKDGFTVASKKDYSSIEKAININQDFFSD